MKYVVSAISVEKFKLYDVDAVDKREAFVSVSRDEIIDTENTMFDHCFSEEDIKDVYEDVWRDSSTEYTVKVTNVFQLPEVL